MTSSTRRLELSPARSPAASKAGLRLASAVRENAERAPNGVSPSRRRRSALAPYGLAAAGVVALAIAGLLLRGTFPEVFLIIPMAATALIAFRLGVGPGVTFGVGVGFGIWYLVLRPRGSFALNNQLQLADLVFFVLASMLVTIAIALLQREHRRLEASRADAARMRDRLALAQEIAGIGTFDGDLEAEAYEWSPELEALHGLAPGAFAGTYEQWSARLHPDDRASLARQLARAVETGAFEGEWRIARPDGALRWVAARGRVFKDGDGKPVRILGVNIDITERKRSEEMIRRHEEALERSEELFRAAFDSFPYTLVLYDAERRYRFVNAAGLAIIGKSLDEVVGRRDEEIVPEEVWSGYLPHLVRTAEARQPQTFEQTRPASVGGGTHVATYVPLMDEAGALRHVLLVTYDVTEIRRAEQSLRESDRRKDEFLAVLSHELRNPLAPVRNALHVLQRAKPGVAAASGPLEVIARQVDHLARLVDDLLDVTRISRGKVRLQVERVDLGEIVRRAADDHRPLLAARGLALEVRCAEAACPVDADPMRIAQIVGNLLQNSAKFTEPGGRVSVAVEREQERASVCVADTGMGIAPEIIGRVFEPFTQADESLHRSRGGLGLGLALVKGFATLHGATVEARSEGVGRGAQVLVSFPLASGAAAAPRPARPAADAPGSPRRVLLIEDNVDAAETLSMALQMAGHEVELAHDGRAGVERARTFRPDVVLCDIGLPEMDGYAVASSLRADPAFSATALVALTGYGLAADRKLALEAGFDLHLTKPASVALIEEALSAARPRDRGAHGA